MTTRHDRSCIKSSLHTTLNLQYISRTILRTSRQGARLDLSGIFFTNWYTDWKLSPSYLTVSDCDKGLRSKSGDDGSVRNRIMFSRSDFCCSLTIGMFSPKRLLWELISLLDIRAFWTYLVQRAVNIGLDDKGLCSSPFVRLRVSLFLVSQLIDGTFLLQTNYMCVALFVFCLHTSLPTRTVACEQCSDTV